MTPAIGRRIAERADARTRPDSRPPANGCPRWSARSGDPAPDRPARSDCRCGGRCGRCAPDRVDRAGSMSPDCTCCIAVVTVGVLQSVQAGHLHAPRIADAEVAVQGLGERDRLARRYCAWSTTAAVRGRCAGVWVSRSGRRSRFPAGPAQDRAVLRLRAWLGQHPRVLRAKPCCGTSADCPSRPKYGQHTGTPPRIASGARLLTGDSHSRSSNPCGTNDSNWPPCNESAARGQRRARSAARAGPGTRLRFDRSMHPAPRPPQCSGRRGASPAHNASPPPTRRTAAARPAARARRAGAPAHARR